MILGRVNIIRTPLCTDEVDPFFWPEPSYIPQSLLRRLGQGGRLALSRDGASVLHGLPHIENALAAGFKLNHSSSALWVW